MTDRISELTQSKLALERATRRIHQQWKDGAVSDYEYTQRHHEYTTLAAWVDCEIRAVKAREEAA